MHYPAVFRRLWALVCRKSVEQQLDDELAFHLQMQREENERQGMAEEAARLAAIRSFGSVAKSKESCREQKGVPLAEAVGQDVRYGTRKLLGSPLYSTVVLLTLALGIGANTAVFSLLDTVLLRPLPFSDPDRIVVIWENDRIRGTSRETGSYPDFLDIKGQAKSFESIAGSSSINATLTGVGEPERFQGARVTEDYFRVMGIEPVVGRAFTDQEFRNADRTPVIIGYQVWDRKFGKEARIVGRSVVLDGVRHTVVGVAPLALSRALVPFHAPEVWLPLTPGANEQYRGMHNVALFGRLRDRTSIERAQLEMSGIMSRLEQAFQDDNKGRGAELVALQEQLVGGSRASLHLLQAAVGAVLLIGCLNLANLLMARLSARRNELAVRSALGATRGRIIRQLLTETVLLVALGGSLALGIARLLMKLLASLEPEIVPRLDQMELSWPVLLFLMSVALLTAVMFGIGPAVAMSKVPVDHALKAGTRTTTENTRARRVRETLVTVQVALALVLLVAAGVLVKSFWRLSHTDPGYDPRQVLQLSLELPSHRYPPPEKWPFLKWPEVTNATNRLVEGIRTLPTVESVALALHSPLAGGWSTRVTVVGRPAPAPGDRDEAEFCPVDEHYFRTLRIPIQAGRAFAATDDDRHPPVAIVNQAFVRRHFPGENPVNASIDVFGIKREVVGVSGDMKPADGFTIPTRPAVYLPFRQNPMSGFNLLIRTSGDPLQVLDGVRAKIGEVDQELTPYNIATLVGGLSASFGQPRFISLVVGSFAVAALALAAVGIYGMISYSVAQRAGEIGIRLAVGARHQDIYRREVGRVLTRIAVGLTLGIAVAVAAGRLLSSLLHEVSPADPVVIFAVSVSVLIVGVVASCMPIRHLLALDPVGPLRRG